MFGSSGISNRRICVKGLANVTFTGSNSSK
jgi:hypothetical protein